MRFVSKLGLAAALATAMIAGGAAVPAQAAKEKAPKAPKLKLSSGFQSAYATAVKALNGGDVEASKAAMASLKGAASNDDDKYVLGTYMIQLGGKMNDQALQLEGLKTSLASATTPQAERGKFAFYAGQMSYGAGAYEDAISYMDQARAAGYQDDNVGLIGAEANFKLSRYPAGFAALKALVDAKAAAGTSAPEGWLGRGVNVARQANDNAQLVYWGKELVKYYPTKDNWRSALVLFREGVNLSNAENLDLMRLMRKTDSLVSERDYAEYSDAADPRRLPAEVVSVLQEGMAKGNFKNSTYLTEQLTSAKARVAEDKASLAPSERDAAGAPNGKIALATADGYFGHGDYAKALKMYDLAVTKGGIDMGTAYTRRGMTKLALNDAQGAKADFALVDGANRKSIIDFWMLYVNQQSAPAAAPAATPAG